MKLVINFVKDYLINVKLYSITKHGELFVSYSITANKESAPIAAVFWGISGKSGNYCLSMEL